MKSFGSDPESEVNFDTPAVVTQSNVLKFSLIYRLTQKIHFLAYMNICVNSCMDQIHCAVGLHVPLILECTVR